MASPGQPARPSFAPAGDFASSRAGQPIRPTKTAIRLARRIVEDIISNDFGPDSRLPQEKEMLEHYRVGRATLREALRHLEFLGILHIRSGPSGGPIVLEPSGNNLGSVLGLLLTLSRTQFGEVIAVYEVLEPTMAASAATNSSDEIVRLLRASVNAMSDENLTEDQFLDENRNFHDLIAKGSGNRVLEFFNESLLAIIDGAVVGVHYSRRRRKVVIDSHEEITIAIERRDPDAARAAMEKHIGDWKRYVSKRYPEALTRPLTWSPDN
jgi:GntR family transcriptional regulator, transcriptional repressor for pyruvate dehydrogenase complex